MSKVNYYLKGVPSNKTFERLKKDDKKSYNRELNIARPVVLSVSHKGKRDLFTTGKFIPLRFWDKESKRVKNLLETSPIVITNGELEISVSQTPQDRF